MCVYTWHACACVRAPVHVPVCLCAHVCMRACACVDVWHALPSAGAQQTFVGPNRHRAPQREEGPLPWSQAAAGVGSAPLPHGHTGCFDPHPGSSAAAVPAWRALPSMCLVPLPPRLCWPGRGRGGRQVVVVTESWGWHGAGAGASADCHTSQGRMTGCGGRCGVTVRCSVTLLRETRACQLDCTGGARGGLSVLAGEVS